MVFILAPRRQCNPPRLAASTASPSWEDEAAIPNSMVADVGSTWSKPSERAVDKFSSFFLAEKAVFFGGIFF